MKRNHQKKVTLLITILVLVFSLLLSGCSGRRTVTAEEFQAACESTGYTVTDQTASFEAYALVTALTVSTEDTDIGFFVFSDPASAKSNYAQMLSSLKTGASGEKYVDSSEYNRFYYSGDNGTNILYRNGATLLFGSSQNSESLNELIDALGI